ncbi:MAG TPA: type III-B CRISPR module-associated protein Cmr5 [Bacteroidales bacterium]|nr:type III-B CRISPR module-associated protein Cmr5 [Bacteroidales bacterium]
MALENMNLKRANFALNLLSGKSSEYKNAVKKLLPLIRNNGLIAALAFYKADKKHKNVYRDVSTWIKKQGMIERDAVRELVQKDSLEVLRITKEVEAFTGWLKRLADSEIS